MMGDDLLGEGGEQRDRYIIDGWARGSPTIIYFGEAATTATAKAILRKLDTR